MQALTQETTTISRGEYLATQARVLWYYIRLFLWPAGLHLDHSFPLSASLFDRPVIIAILGHLLFVVFAFSCIRRFPFLTFAILFYYLAHLVESSVIPIRDVLFEHRTYLPNAGLCIGGAWLLTSLSSQSEKSADSQRIGKEQQKYNNIKKLNCKNAMKSYVLRFHQKFAYIGFLVVVSLLFALGTITWQRNNLWRDPVLFWEDCVAQSPNNYRPLHCLGDALLERQKYESALKYSLKSLRIFPGNPKTHNNIGLIYNELGKRDRAIYHLTAAIQLDKKFAAAHYNLGSVYDELGDQHQALKHYLDSIRLNPGLAEVYNNVGFIYASQGDTSKAINYYNQALQIDPRLAEAHNNLGLAFAENGEPDQSIAHYSEALRINPNFAEAHNNLGLIYAQQGVFDKAALSFEKALAIEPEFAETNNYLGLVHARQGNYKKAIDYFTKALRINPDYEEARNNMERAQQKLAR